MKKLRISVVKRQSTNRIDQREVKKGPVKGKYPLTIYFRIAVIMFVVGFSIYFLAQSAVKDQLITSNSQILKAIVIDEKNFTGHSPVKQQFYYSYQFLIGGQTYKGNTNNSRFHVGDSVFIRFVKSNPSINEIITH